jgi:hypothetical protein
VSLRAEVAPATNATMVAVTNRVSIAAVIETDPPTRWVESALAQVAQIGNVELRAIVVDGNTPEPRRPRLATTILRLYSLADGHAYPLESPALDPAPLRPDLRRLCTQINSVHDVEWFVDLREDGHAGDYPARSRRGLIRARNELEAPGDRTVLDAVRRRSPIATKVEVVDQGGCRVVAQTVGACHPVSLRHTLDAAYRRSEVLLVRAVRVLADGA